MDMFTVHLGPWPVLAWPGRCLVYQSVGLAVGGPSERPLSFEARPLRLAGLAMLEAASCAFWMAVTVASGGVTGQ